MTRAHLMTLAAMAKADEATNLVTSYETFVTFLKRCAVNDHTPLLSHPGRDEQEARAWATLRNEFAIRGLKYR